MFQYLSASELRVMLQNLEAMHHHPTVAESRAELAQTLRLMAMRVRLRDHVVRGYDFDTWQRELSSEKDT